MDAEKLLLERAGKTLVVGKTRELGEEKTVCPKKEMGGG